MQCLGGWGGEAQGRPGGTFSRVRATPVRDGSCFWAQITNGLMHAYQTSRNADPSLGPRRLGSYHQHHTLPETRHSGIGSEK